MLNSADTEGNSFSILTRVLQSINLSLKLCLLSAFENMAFSRASAY